MELFSELYSCYYAVAARVLEEAAAGVRKSPLPAPDGAGGTGATARSAVPGLRREDIERLVAEHAFSESALHLLPRLLSEEWGLLERKGERYVPRTAHGDAAMPATALQKAWLRGLLDDRRIGLFLTDDRREAWRRELAEIPPLFRWDDFHTFDAASDGDPYDDDRYRAHFRLLLEAVRTGAPLLTEYAGARGGRSTLYFLPDRMLYSPRDDKFRVRGWRLVKSRRKAVTLNLARIEALSPSGFDAVKNRPPAWETPRRRVVIAIRPERNALERCSLQFAAYEKTTEYDGELDCYRSTIVYDDAEESELLIRLLSFGPAVEVLSPPGVRRQVRERILRQAALAENG